MDNRPKSEYELLREKNIRRNENRLKDLGLYREPPSPLPPRKKVTKKRRGELDVSGLRRSSRHKGKLEIDYRESDAILSKIDGMEKGVSGNVKEDGDANRKEEKIKHATPVELDNVDLAPYTGGGSSGGKARDTSVNLGVVLEEKLGKMMEHTGKACVVDFMGNATKNTTTSDAIRTIGFNKMSGILEFKDVIVLWVNIGGKDNDFDNQFFDGGREVSWFGGSRMHGETPVIKKLVKWSKRGAKKEVKEEEGVLTNKEGRGDENNSGGGKNSVVMWCRFVDGRCVSKFYSFPFQLLI